MAAGVGKTYRMLQEGHAELEAGRDVVIGYLEPHGRAETERARRGLPQVARRRVDTATSRSARWTSRRCSRAPGARADRRARAHERARRRARQALRGHRGRARGRHRRVLHGQRAAPGVAQRPGRRAHGRARARDVPRLRAVRRRRGRARRHDPAGADRAARAGKVYKPERVPAALNGFFRVENLEALREVALRQVAEGVEAKRLVREPRRSATSTG